jgi:uncharacterized sporulation protein YeaH/YhbH (DUF444 family)
MSQVRRRHEDIFIAHVTNADNISKKYHFGFNHKWGTNNSDAKRITVRKIKDYPMSLTGEVGFAIDDANNAQ